MKIYIVQKGDSLYKIAQKHQVDVDEVIKLNTHIANPNYIVPGMKIKLPTKTGMHESTEKSGERKHEKSSYEARTNERPFGSVKEMNDRGMSHMKNPIPLNTNHYSLQGSAVAPKQSEEKNKQVKAHGKPFKTYSDNQYRHTARAPHEPGQQMDFKQPDRRPSGFPPQQDNLNHIRPQAPYPYMDPRQQPYCPCCMYHWHMQQTMMMPANEDNKNKRIYY